MPENNKLTASEKERLYQQILEYSFEPTVVHSNYKILYINEAGAEFFGAKKEEIIGANVVDVFTKNYRDFILERIQKATVERKVGELVETRVHKFDGTTVEVDLYCHPAIYGDTEAIQSIIRDITNRKDVERKLDKVMNEIGTPVVPVLEGVAVIPLVGSVDVDRVNQLLEIIPQKIQGHSLQHLIIDVSGIYDMDAVVADFLYKINSIMKLLGISLIYTGLRPELARKAVEGSGNIRDLTSISNVKQALRSIIN